MVDDKLIESIFGWMGLAISTYFYLSPAVPYYKVLRGDIDYKDSPAVLLFCNIMNCILWIDYGLLKGTFQVYLTCSIGGTITLIWITIYIIFLSKKRFFISLLILILFLGILIGLAYYVFYMVLDVEITGIAALVFNILMLAAPGEKIYTVIKTGKYELIPIYSTIGTILCAASWFIFGIYQKDLNLIIPNGLGLLFGFFQLLVYCIFYKKRASYLPEDESDQVI